VSNETKGVNLGDVKQDIKKQPLTEKYGGPDGTMFFNEAEAE
jgi:hypothetical protein